VPMAWPAAASAAGGTGGGGDAVAAAIADLLQLLLAAGQATKILPRDTLVGRCTLTL